MTAAESAFTNVDRRIDPSRERKAVLLVAYHFPPSSGQALPGTQRAVKLCKYLPEFGWIPHALTITESSYPWYIERDPDLLANLPSDQAVSRTGVIRILRPLVRTKDAILRSLRNLSRRSEKSHSNDDLNSASSGSDTRSKSFQKFKDFVTDLFEVPDEIAGWIIPGVLTGRRLARESQFAAIIATGRPWSSLVIGAIVSRVTRLPLITDFRDPWMTNPFRGQHSAIKNWLDRALERFVIRQSSVVIANTDLLREEFVQRFPREREEKFICISNGFDPEEQMPVPGASADQATKQRFVLVHAGFLYGRRDPRPLIDAVGLALQNARIPREQLSLRLVGPRELSFSLKAYVSERGLDDVIQIIDPVPYEESLKLVSECSFSILLQPDTLTQVPSKLFENVGLGKRTLAVAERGSATERLFQNHDLGYFAPCDNANEIEDTLVEAYESWRSAESELKLDSDTIDMFNIRSRIALMSTKLDEIAGSRSVGAK